MGQTKARRMRELLEKGIVVSPGVFDSYKGGRADYVVRGGH